MNRDQFRSGLFSLLDAASELGGISPWTLRKHIGQGTIRVTRLGKRIFLSSQEISRIQREGLPSLKSKSGRASRDAEDLVHTKLVQANGGADGSGADETKS